MTHALVQPHRPLFFLLCQDCAALPALCWLALLALGINDEDPVPRLQPHTDRAEGGTRYSGTAWYERQRSAHDQSPDAMQG